MKRRRQRGFSLIEAVVALFLLFLSALTVYNLLQTSADGYAQATQVRMALRLAEQNLAQLRAGNVSKSVGTQNLAAVALQFGQSTIQFNPTTIVSSQGTVLLVRSQVSWTIQALTHQLEVKSYVLP